jgi:hypothetical protein
MRGHGSAQPLPWTQEGTRGRSSPPLRSLAHALACYDGTAEFERGLDILITGLSATLSPPGTSRPPGSTAHDDLPDDVSER